MSIRVYATADTDTDTITPCISVPATYIIILGRSFRERSYFMQWVALTPSKAKHVDN